MNIYLKFSFIIQFFPDKRNISFFDDYSWNQTLPHIRQPIWDSYRLDLIFKFIISHSLSLPPPLSLSLFVYHDHVCLSVASIPFEYA